MAIIRYFGQIFLHDKKTKKNRRGKLLKIDYE